MIIRIYALRYLIATGYLLIILLATLMLAVTIGAPKMIGTKYRNIFKIISC